MNDRIDPMEPTPTGAQVNEELIRAAVAEDHRLEAQADMTQEQLCHHRWHWTLDQSNPDCISLRAYAKTVGRSERRIRMMVNGYSEWCADPGSAPLGEYIERAKLSDDKSELYEATAKAAGVTFQNIAKNNTALAKDVKQAAEQRAKSRGTTPREEYERAAESVVQSMKARKAEKLEKTAAPRVRMLTVEGHLASALLALKNALRDSDDELTEGDREFLGDTITKLRNLLNMLDARITGTTDIDWDAELAKLGELT